jgi:hypothetical protein
MFLGLPDPDPLVRGMDPDPDSSIIKQTSKTNLDSYCFVTSLGLTTQNVMDPEHCKQLLVTTAKLFIIVLS